MAILRDADRQAIKKELDGLTGPVKLINFTQELECQYCKETNQIIKELSELSDKITSETYNFVTDKEMADRFKIDKIPATIVMGAEDRGIRFYGIPSGYEFISLLEAIKMAASGDSGLSPESKKILGNLKAPLHLQVFVTPTCPYCPRAVSLAHRLAFESPNVTADMVEATEFPHLAIKYQVMGVPRTVINEDLHIEGAVPEQTLLQRIAENYT